MQLTVPLHAPRVLVLVTFVVTETEHLLRFGQLFAQQVSNALINTAAAGAERGRSVLSDQGEQASIDLVLPLFSRPLRSGEVGRLQPLDLVEVVGKGGTWHGLCTASRIEARAGEGAIVV